MIRTEYALFKTNLHLWINKLIKRFFLQIIGDVAWNINKVKEAINSVYFFANNYMWHPQNKIFVCFNRTDKNSASWTSTHLINIYVACVFGKILRWLIHNMSNLENLIFIWYKTKRLKIRRGQASTRPTKSQNI